VYRGAEDDTSGAIPYMAWYGEVLLEPESLKHSNSLVCRTACPSRPVADSSGVAMFVRPSELDDCDGAVRIGNRCLKYNPTTGNIWRVN
jgi:hypothetical protein